MPSYSIFIYMWNHFIFKLSTLEFIKKIACFRAIIFFSPIFYFISPVLIFNLFTSNLCIFKKFKVSNIKVIFVGNTIIFMANCQVS